MRDDVTIMPVQYNKILHRTKECQFTMASDLFTGSLLKTLVAAKPGGNMLELGTGTGLSTSWMLEGMTANATLTSVDNNELLQSVARENLPDTRINFICADGYEWIKQYQGDAFDLIFADAMPGKYDLMEETLAMVKTGGFYILDDMLPQPNWPPGHAEKAAAFIAVLENRKDLQLTKMNWSTGIIICVKIK